MEPMDPLSKTLLTMAVNQGIPIMKSLYLSQVDQKTTERTVELNRQMLIERRQALMGKPRPQNTIAPEATELSPESEEPSLKDMDGRLSWDVMTKRLSYYPLETKEDRKLMDKWIRTTVETNVCPICSNHGVEYMHDHPPDLRTNETALKWVCNFRNSVRKDQGKEITHPCD